MKIKALCSFAGAITMAKDEVKDCDDMYIVNDLLSSGYVEAVETLPLGESEPDKTVSEKKPRKRTVKDDEDKRDHEC